MPPPMKSDYRDGPPYHPIVMIVVEDPRTVDSMPNPQFHPATSHLVIIITEIALVRPLETITTIPRFLPLALLVNTTTIGGTLGGPPFLPLHLDIIHRPIMQTTVIPSRCPDYEEPLKPAKAPKTLRLKTTRPWCKWALCARIGGRMVIKVLQGSPALLPLPLRRQSDPRGPSVMPEERIIWTDDMGRLFGILALLQPGRIERDCLVTWQAINVDNATLGSYNNIPVTSTPNDETPALPWALAPSTSPPTLPFLSPYNIAFTSTPTTKPQLFPGPSPYFFSRALISCLNPMFSPTAV
ncbi:hypothetical protein BS47DRAFT_1398158 [Hydnum rufescens UP504]|uniref:Uncharacterized protein n=1 Tax=Hydnum rufescens UP504 TaxID=1448309 RepID=A0A9P6ANH6_9AGAM|nr:hypothetical protein BS47DRAFT_1398158 [Hydnum rufescens UP504]